MSTSWRWWTTELTHCTGKTHSELEETVPGVGPLASQRPLLSAQNPSYVPRIGRRDRTRGPAELPPDAREAHGRSHMVVLVVSPEKNGEDCTLHRSKCHLGSAKCCAGSERSDLLLRMPRHQSRALRYCSVSGWLRSGRTNAHMREHPSGCYWKRSCKEI